MTDSDLPPRSDELGGRVALVTGATSGLGWRFARVLANAGATVVATGRREERLDQICEAIAKDGGRAVGYRLDMTDAEAIQAVVARASDEVGLVDVLVNNAGVPDAQRAHKMDLELIDRVLDTNLRGPYVLSVEVAKRLIAEKAPGRMVNIASVGAFAYHGEGAALYSISKAAIVRMSEVLAVEWSRNFINVNCIAPGAFASEMMDGMLERMGDFTGNFPRKRLGQPAQLDTTLLYFCSPASEVVTGTIVKIDDGQGGR